MRFLADENFDNDILRGVRASVAEFDVVRVQDTEIYQADDSVVLEWAARQGRILLTHDVRTIRPIAYARVRAGVPMPGVLLIRKSVPLAVAVDALLLVIGATQAAEWENRVTFLPLR